jgi:hypothetical protein
MKYKGNIYPDYSNCVYVVGSKISGNPPDLIEHGSDPEVNNAKDGFPENALVHF